MESAAAMAGDSVWEAGSDFAASDDGGEGDDRDGGGETTLSA